MYTYHARIRIRIHARIRIHIHVTRSHAYYFYARNSMNELIDTLSAYDNIPVFVKIVQEYNDEQYMPVPDYDYELEQLQKEVEQLEQIQIRHPEWKQRLARFKETTHGSFKYFGDLLRDTRDMDEMEAIGYIEYCWNDPDIRVKSMEGSGYNQFSSTFLLCGRSRKYILLDYLIQNILPQVHKFSVGYTFHDLLIHTAMWCKDIEVVKWVINNYNITKNTLAYYDTYSRWYEAYKCACYTSEDDAREIREMLYE